MDQSIIYRNPGTLTVIRSGLLRVHSEVLAKLGHSDILGHTATGKAKLSNAQLGN